MRRPEDLLRAFAFAVALALGGGEAEALYDVGPGEIPGKPGTIIRVWPLTGGGPMGSGADAFRILYRSTDIHGKPIAVSGAIYIPAGAPPAGGRNVIAWAHPTVGVVSACAPSLMPDNAGMIFGLAQMLARNYVVVATDYPGLGTNSIHPFLVGESEARAVIDSVRAARNLPDTGATDRYIVWGHSQGGHASLFTGQISQRYAPELNLVGVAAAAPATYLAELFDADRSSPTGRELTSMVIYAWSKFYGLSANQVVEPAAMPVYLRIARDCIESLPEFLAIDRQERPLQQEKYLAADPTEVEPWKSIMARNTPGQVRQHVPVFISQGTADTTVRPEITKQFAVALCKQGTPVHYVVMPGTPHTYAARDSVGAMLDWAAGRFGGARPPSNCSG
jgi:acetyl esterase/lipase